MKKALAILLVIALAFSIVSCTKTDAPPSTATPYPDATTPDANPDETPDEPNILVPTGSGTVGYITDEVDHFDRDPYKIAYICVSLAAPFTIAIADAIAAYGDVMNYTFYTYDANHDYDAYINQLTMLCEQGYDAFILGTDDAVQARAYEVATSYGVPFVGESSVFVDEDGNCIAPSVAQNQYANGAACVEWLTDNYESYWGEIDTSKLGLIVLDFTPVSGIHEREPGAYDAFVKAFPEAKDNYFHADLATTPSGFSVAGGDELVSGIIPANPDIEHWFITGLVDDWSLGATRAVERLNKGDCTLVASVQADSFISDLDSGSTGDIYVVACAISPAEFGGYMASCVVTILEGRATAETIWPEWNPGGGQHPFISLKGTMITKDTYKQWQQDTSIEALLATVPQY